MVTTDRHDVSRAPRQPYPLRDHHTRHYHAGGGRRIQQYHEVTEDVFSNITLVAFDVAISRRWHPLFHFRFFFPRRIQGLASNGYLLRGKKIGTVFQKSGWMDVDRRDIALSDATSVILPIASAFTFVILLLERWPGERDRVGS